MSRCCAARQGRRGRMKGKLPYDRTREAMSRALGRTASWAPTALIRPLVNGGRVHRDRRPRQQRPRLEVHRALGRGLRLADPIRWASAPMTIVTGVSEGTDRPMFGCVQSTSPGVPTAGRALANLSPASSNCARASDAGIPRTSGISILRAAGEGRSEAAFGGAGGAVRAWIKTPAVTMSTAHRLAPNMIDDRCVTR